MTALAEKHKNLLEESAARLLARAENSRGLETADIFARIEASTAKYVLRMDENASPAEIKEFVETLNADDLCLIIACERGDESAWNEMVAKYDATVKSAAWKFAKNAEDAEDLAGSIWAELYGLKRDAKGKVKTKLAYFSGRGSLAGWLRAVVSQLAIDEFRKTSRLVQIEESREFENLANESSENSGNEKVVHAIDNPEESFSAKQTGNDVSDALQKAVSQLKAEDRLILKLYYFENLKLKDIGAALGFHEATASRKVDRIQNELRKTTEKILIAEKGWRHEEVKRHLADTAAKLDIGLEKTFAILTVCALLQEFFQTGVL